MPTGQVIFNNALTTLGLLEQGGTPSVSDSNDGLKELNNAWQAWGVDEGLIYAIIPFQGKLVANQGAYNIGSGAQFDVQRPARIYKAFHISAVSLTVVTTIASAVLTAASTTGVYIGQSVVGVGIPQGSIVLSFITNTSVTITALATANGSISALFGGNDRNKLDIVEAQKYYAKNDLGATAQTPQELYPDYNADASGYARLYLWPVPLILTPAFLEIDAAVNFATWSLGTTYYVPQGYDDLLNYGLAARLLTRYGAAVDPNIAKLVLDRADKAESRIREMNRFNRQLPPEAVGLQPAVQEK